MKGREQRDIDGKLTSIKNKIQALINGGQYEKAWESLKKLQTAAANDADICSMKSVILLAQNKLSQAEKLLTEGINNWPESFDLLYNLGYTYELQEEIAKAVDVYLKAEMLVSCQEESNDIRAAIDRLQKTPEAEGYIISARTRNTVERITQKIKGREYDKAIEVCEDYLQYNSPLGLVYYYLGVAYNALSDYERAKEYHKKALILDRTLADLRRQIDVFRDTYDETEVCCIGCGREESDTVWVGNQSIAVIDEGLINPLRVWVKCKNCGLIYSNPLPGKDAMDKYYSFFAKAVKKGMYGDIESLFEKKVQLSNNRLSTIANLNKGGKKLLDIGAGTGIFVGTAIDRGWDAAGLELTPEDCKYAKANFNLDLIQEGFYQFDDTGKYDVITMFEVIEHLYTPYKDLIKVNNMIEDRGLLVVATPIADSLYSKKIKEKNPFWHEKSHLTYFSRTTLLDYLNSAGFEVLDMNLSQEGMGRMEFYCRKVREASDKPKPGTIS